MNLIFKCLTFKMYKDDICVLNRYTCVAQQFYLLIPMKFMASIRFGIYISNLKSYNNVTHVKGNPDALDTLA